MRSPVLPRKGSSRFCGLTRTKAGTVLPGRISESLPEHHYVAAIVVGDLHRHPRWESTCMALIETRSRRCRARRRSCVWPLLSILKQGWRDNLRAPGADSSLRSARPFSGHQRRQVCSRARDDEGSAAALDRPDATGLAMRIESGPTDWHFLQPIFHPPRRRAASPVGRQIVWGRVISHRRIFSFNTLPHDAATV